jgi:hypothetical protein
VRLESVASVANIDNAFGLKQPNSKGNVFRIPLKLIHDSCKRPHKTAAFLALCSPFQKNPEAEQLALSVVRMPVSLLAKTLPARKRRPSPQRPIHYFTQL